MGTKDDLYQGQKIGISQSKKWNQQRHKSHKTNKSHKTMVSHPLLAAPRPKGAARSLGRPTGHFAPLSEGVVFSRAHEKTDFLIDSHAVETDA
jgi:hypothetical protein